MELKRFTRDEVKLDQTQAWKVLHLFWPDVSIRVGELTDEDRAFAQSMLTEAIDGKL